MDICVLPRVLLHCYHYSFCCSNCSRFAHWESLQVVPFDVFGSLCFTSVPAAGACLTRTCRGQACIPLVDGGAISATAQAASGRCVLLELVDHCRVAQLVAAKNPEYQGS